MYTIFIYFICSNVLISVFFCSVTVTFYFFFKFLNYLTTGLSSTTNVNTYSNKQILLAAYKNVTYTLTYRVNYLWSLKFLRFQMEPSMIHTMCNNKLHDITRVSLELFRLISNSIVVFCEHFICRF